MQPAWRLSRASSSRADAASANAQIASVTNYVLQTFGNPTVQVTAQLVATARKGGASSPLIGLVDFGLPLAAAAAAILAAFAAWLI
jgi:hypothetical protein